MFILSLLSRKNWEALTEHSSLNEETISALRMVKDAIRLFGEGHAFNIPVTDAVRHSARAAHQKYKEAQQFSFATRKCWTALFVKQEKWTSPTSKCV